MNLIHNIIISTLFSNPKSISCTDSNKISDHQSKNINLKTLLNIDTKDLIIQDTSGFIQITNFCIP